TVRRQLSDIKGGALLRSCRAGLLVTLVISDVPGDPLPLIASGPTIPTDSDPDEALAVLTDLGLRDEPALGNVVRFLESRMARPALRSEAVCEHHAIVLANNATAVDAAGVEAERLGYRHAMISANAPEGPAEQVG